MCFLLAYCGNTFEKVTRSIVWQERGQRSEHTVSSTDSNLFATLKISYFRSLWKNLCDSVLNVKAQGDTKTELAPPTLWPLSDGVPRVWPWLWASRAWADHSVPASQSLPLSARLSWQDMTCPLWGFPSQTPGVSTFVRQPCLCSQPTGAPSA